MQLLPFAMATGSFASTSTNMPVTAQVVLPPPRSTPLKGKAVTTAGELPGTQFNSLLAAIKSSEARIEQRFVDFKTEIKGAQEEAASKAASRVRREKPYDYKKKAHEEQATFNGKLEEAVKEASAALEEVADSPALRRAKAALREGEALLVERQKLIKITTRSVVAEYTADELADDSDDEKRLEKAEKAAERKAGLKRKRRQQPLRVPRGQRQYPGPQVYGGYTANPPPHFPTAAAVAVPVAEARAGGLSTSVQRGTVGPCFACGDMGHLRSYCPRTQAQEKKWYPYFTEMIM
jgi:hypothetical protein